jgi:DNA-binding transcriptional MerR regulator/DNA gyrase inhibitor GyrI
MLGIGEFSKVTSLTIKTIRLYHEKGLLPPARVDGETGYRYYDHQSVERARVIVELRRLDFSLAEVKEIIDSSSEDGDLLTFLEKQQEAIAGKLKRYKEISRSIELIIRNEREVVMANHDAKFEVEEKTAPTLLIAGIRIKGRYADCGKLFGRLARSAGRQISGKPLNLYYDCEYKEEDADFESCFPVRKAFQAEGIAVRELPGGKCVALVHRGPYQEIGRSYERLFSYVRENGLRPRPPSREVYLKGPGMIFKGNPKKYLTEIQVLVE